MRAIFAKELRQNHLLIWLGFLLSAMIAVLYFLWSRQYVRTVQDQRDLDGFCDVLLLIATGVIILTASAGLFSSETGRGTLPFLLGLPVSRARIWLAKALAGLAIAACAAILLITPVALILPQVVREIPLLLFLPDIIVGALVLFSVTLFCSTVFQRNIGVLLTSALIGLAVYLASGLFLSLNGPILGYDAVLDVSFLALLVTIPFLTASLFAFTRGELLQSRRRWGLALPSLLIGIAVIYLAVAGATRVAYRYQRSGVMSIQSASLPPLGRTATLTAFGSPAPYKREMQRGWVKERGEYRSQHDVVLDLATGREMLVLSSSRLSRTDESALSPDGRYLARSYPGWFGSSPSRIDIWDLRAHRRVYSGVPRTKSGAFAGGPLQWSPVGDWLALDATEDHVTDVGVGGDPPRTLVRESLLIMLPDGSQRTEILLMEATTDGDHWNDPNRVTSWVWALDGSALYTLTLAGRIVRHTLPGGEARTVAQVHPDISLPPDEQWRFGFDSLAVSPDGRWLSMRFWGYARNASKASATHAIMVMSADGSRAITIDGGQPQQFWSPDSRILYLVDFAEESVSISRWQPGQTRAVPVSLPPDLPGARPAVLKDGSLLLWCERDLYIVDLQGRVAPARSPDLRALPTRSVFIGVDALSRLIVEQGASRLSAADLQTGKVTKLYP